MKLFLGNYKDSVEERLTPHKKGKFFGQTKTMHI